jgi:nitroreductase
MSSYPTIPYRPFRPELPTEQAAEAFLRRMALRRSVRSFSPRAVSRATIEACIAAANTAPSGANKQPWRFVAVADPTLKRSIRAAAEEEERAFYAGRANPDWLRDLAPLGTDPEKPFLEIAPWLVVVFKVMRDEREGRASEQVYYVNESVGIAVGLFIAAVHHAGLVTLTHTPSPMRFLSELLGVSEHDRPFVLLPVGYPEEGCAVPDIPRKRLDEVAVWR